MCLQIHQSHWIMKLHVNVIVFLLLQRKPLQSDRIFVFYCYRYIIFFVDNRLNPGQVDTCLTLARLLVGWLVGWRLLSIAYTTLLIGILLLFLLMLLNCICNIIRKTQRKSMLTPMMWCEWNYVVITHDEQIPLNVTRAKREKLRRIFFILSWKCLYLLRMLKRFNRLIISVISLFSSFGVRASNVHRFEVNSVASKIANNFYDDMLIWGHCPIFSRCSN